MKKSKRIYQLTSLATVMATAMVATSSTSVRADAPPIPVPAISPLLFGGPSPLPQISQQLGGILPINPINLLLGGGAAGFNQLTSLIGNSPAGQTQLPYLRDGLLSVLALLPGSGQDDGNDLPPDYLAAHQCVTPPDLTQGAVYHGSQELEGNRIFAWYRDCNGVLTSAGTFAAGGVGSGLGSAVNGFNGGATQGGLRLSQDGRFLFTTNTGTNEVVVFRVDPHELVLVDKKPSGGGFPTALAVRGVTLGGPPGILYVENRVDGSMMGYSVDGEGHLAMIPGSQRTASDGPLCNVGEIEFTPDGRKLIGVCRETEFPFLGIAPIGISGFGKWIDVFDVASDGTLQNQRPHDANQYEPFAFDFDGQGRMVNAEGNFITPGVGTVSMYRINEDNTMQSMANSPVRMLAQGDTCWTRILGPNNDQLYTMGFNEGSIIHSTIYPDGTIRPNRVVANTSIGGLPIPAGFDIWESRDDKFLYAYNWPGGLTGYRVEPDWSLTKVTHTPGPLGGISGGLLPALPNLDSALFQPVVIGSYSMTAW